MMSIQLQKAFSRNLLSSSLDILVTTMAYILILDWFIEKKLHRGHEAHPWTPFRGKNVLVQGSAPHSGMLDYFEIKTGLTKIKVSHVKLYIIFHNHHRGWTKGSTKTWAGQHHATDGTWTLSIQLFFDFGSAGSRKNAKKYLMDWTHAKTLSEHWTVELKQIIAVRLLFPNSHLKHSMIPSYETFIDPLLFHSLHHPLLVLHYIHPLLS